jgi:O-antigen ligase
LPVVIILIALVLSYERNAWLGGFAGLLSLGMMKGKRAFIGIGIAVPLVALLVSVLEPENSWRLKSIGNPAYISNRQRIEMAEVTFETFKANPLLGVGGSNYGQASEPYRQKYGVISKSHPHNNLFSQTAEKGLLGLVAFLYLWYVFFKKSWFAWRNTTDALSQALAAGGVASLIGFHVAGMFEANFGDSEVAMMMWLIVGFVMLILTRGVAVDRSH